MNQNQLDRRRFLQATSAAAVATMGMSAPRLAFGAAGEQLVQPIPKADACILLWMAGGMAAPDTFDPKAYLPFEKGLPVERVMSTFPAIDTVSTTSKSPRAWKTSPR